VYTRAALGACVLLVLNGGSLPAQDRTANDTNHQSDRLAIEKSTQEMIEAFDKRNAAAVAAHWIDQGEFIHNDGEPIRSRAEIEKGYAEFFNSLKVK
jgi:ketosteroid isomerase-like protein